MYQYGAEVFVQPSTFKRIKERLAYNSSFSDGTRNIYFWMIKNCDNTETDGKVVFSKSYEGYVDVRVFWVYGGCQEEEFIKKIPTEELRLEYYRLCFDREMGYDIDWGSKYSFWLMGEDGKPKRFKLGV